MNQQTKQIIIASITIIIAFIGFKMFFSSDSAPDQSIQPDNSTTQFVDGQAILALLTRLDQVTLDGAIFTRDTFNGLVDFERPIPDQVPGRINPFAPVGTDGSSLLSVPATSTTKTK